MSLPEAHRLPLLVPSFAGIILSPVCLNHWPPEVTGAGLGAVSPFWCLWEENWRTRALSYFCFQCVPSCDFIFALPGRNRPCNALHLLFENSSNPVHLFSICLVSQAIDLLELDLFIRRVLHPSISEAKDNLHSSAVAAFCLAWFHCHH